MKTIYFVRHGETPLNKAHIHQYPETPLSATGREQALAAAQALQGKNIEVVIASDLTRAQETASIIADTLCVPQVVAEELREVRRPTYIWGKRHYGLTSLLFFVRYFTSSVVGNIRLKNEETLRDFEARVGSALEHIAKRPEQHIVVVTHRGVMSILGATMRANGNASPVALILSFLGMYAVDNGEITIAKYDGESWCIQAHNKNKHLK